MRLILASKSPRRKELLDTLELPFLQDIQNVDETLDTSIPIDEAIKNIVLHKAKASLKAFPDDLILAADTMVIYNQEALGKPKNRKDAKRILQLLQNKCHEVYTCFALVSKDSTKVFLTTNKVTFYELSNEDIETYLDGNEYADKAGAYGIQGKGAFFVKEIQGDYYSIVGLPIALVRRELNKYIEEEGLE